MPMGYCGKILHVNLSTREFKTEEPDDKFYRFYLGGSCMGSYYVSRLMKRADAFDPENVLVFATSPVIGASLAVRLGLMTAKSPLTGGWETVRGGTGAELKWPALMPSDYRQSIKPVYLILICEYRLLDGLIFGENHWGAWQMIRDELADDKVRIVLIDRLGESVRFACITMN